MLYVIAYTACYVLGTWQCSFAIAGNGQTTNVFEAKFDWNKDDTIFYNTVISSQGMIGLAVGSFGGGSLIKIGRRKTAIIAHIIAICASSICMYDSVFMLSLGRFVLGISAGLANMVYGKSITENFPEKLASWLAMLLNAGICCGIFVALLMGGLLPDPEDKEANKSDENWRLIYAAPGIIGVVELILILFIFRYEPIAYCVSKGFEEEG